MEASKQPTDSNDYALAKKLDFTATYLVHGLCDMLRHLEFLDYGYEDSPVTGL